MVDNEVVFSALAEFTHTLVQWYAIADVLSGTSYLSQDDQRPHFGLGDATRVDRVRIRWPNGNTQELGGLEADRYVTLREPR